MGKRPPSLDIEKGAPVKHPPRPPPPPPPEKWCSWLVPLIFAANVTLFIYSMYVNDCPANTGADICVFYDPLGRFSFQPLRENAVLGPSITTLQNLGALDPVAVVMQGESWRLFTCIWLHAGVAHLFANMMSLLFIGIRLLFDTKLLDVAVKIGLLYVLAGFGGSLMSSLNPKPNISVGASGALLGLLGCMLSELLMNWTILSIQCAAITNLLLIIALNLALGLIPRVDNSAHIGGFLSGFLLGFILLMRPQYGYVSPKNIQRCKL